MSNLENPIGSGKGHPQIWKGPMAYTTNDIYIYMYIYANLGRYHLQEIARYISIVYYIYIMHISAMNYF